MSYTYLQEQGAVSSAASFSDIPASVLSRLNLTAAKSSCSDSAMAFCPSFPSGMTCEPSTASRGADSLTLCAEGSLVRTLAAPERALDWAASVPAFGEKCGESLAKYDPASHSLKTRQCLLFEDSTESLQTLPAWGWMHDGDCFAVASTDCCTTESGCSFWPTPQRIDEDFCRMTVASASKEGHQIHVTTELIRLNGKRYPKPSFAEALMKRPIGYSKAGEPLAMDKFQQWLRSHGRS